MKYDLWGYRFKESVSGESARVVYDANILADSSWNINVCTDGFDADNSGFVLKVTSNNVDIVKNVKISSEGECVNLKEEGTDSDIVLELEKGVTDVTFYKRDSMRPFISSFSLEPVTE